MERVTGIGGFFFRSGNPDKLAQWYERHLGITPVPKSYDESTWVQQGGSTVFAPFEQDTDYFGAPAQTWMINFRVNDLQAVVSQLEAEGIHVKIDPQEYPNGKFARLEDPEGNPIELWQPNTI